ncbi:hypothetical protein EON81_07950 [bacterium]|nr:MAG: hypothetical protein EON81_07950 [bacterium]
MAELVTQPSAADSAQLPTSEVYVSPAEPIRDEVLGLLIDPETGEVVGTIEGLPAPNEQILMDGQVDDILRRIGRAQSQRTSLDSDADLLWAKGILANHKALTKEADRKLDFLTQFYEPALKRYTIIKTAGQKSRTVKRVLGSLALRKVAGGLRVNDADAATQWALVHAPEAFKVERSFLIRNLSDEVRKGLITMLNDDTLEAEEIFASVRAAFLYQPEAEKLDIKTGVGKEGEEA